MKRTIHLSVCLLLTLFAPAKQEITNGISLLQLYNATSISAVQLKKEEQLVELPDCTETDLLMHEDQRAMGPSPDNPEIPDDPPCRVTPEAIHGLQAFHNAVDRNAEDLSFAAAQGAAPEEYNTSAASSMSQFQTNATKFSVRFLHLSVYKVHKGWCKPPCHGPSWENA